MEKLRLSLPLAMPVITWLCGYPRLSAFFSRVIYYRSSFPLEQAFFADQGPTLSWQGGNVSGLAVALTHLAGWKTLALAGTHFQNEGQESHVAGTGYDYFEELRTNRLLRLPIRRQRTSAEAWQALQSNLSRSDLKLHPTSASTEAQPAPLQENASSNRPIESAFHNPPGGLSLQVFTETIATADLLRTLKKIGPRLELPPPQLQKYNRIADILLSKNSGPGDPDRV